ncbi:MAG: hypothetical protein GC192_08015 [Bacteroidetes bacterium]|nr:hypothetical protein [Bacteroidota bacterium]
MSKPSVPTKEAIQETIEQRLETDDNLKSWFQHYNKHAWKNFIQHYAHRKSLALQHPDLHIDDFKPKNKAFNDLALRALEQIQQKKLFNLQCQWRAGSIDLPFVQVTYDFDIFGRNIMQCPFLPPVELDEVELFMQFLQSPDGYEWEATEWTDWQDYETFKREQETGQFRDTPDWYEFYDGRCGTGYLLNLPDNKGPKEEYYRKVFRDHKYPQMAKPRLPDDEFYKPYPHGAKIEIDFAKQFEDPDTAEIIISHIKYWDHHYSHETLDEHYEYLKKIPETFPMVPHHDWREALRLTVVQYKNERVVDALPRIWRKYIRDVGDDREAYINRRIASTSKDILKELDSDDLRHFYFDNILEARKLLGEPEDFDY